MDNQPSKATILIVEDEAGPRDALRMILRPFFNLLTADSAHAALRLLREQEVDLVTLDLKLPDRQGMDLLHDIKLEREDIEAIVITGYGSLKSAMDGARYGAAAYLLKPFNVTELVSLINQTLEKKQRLDCLRTILRSHSLRWGTEQAVAQSWRMLKQEYFSRIQPRQAGVSRVDEYSECAPLLSDLLESKGRDLFNHSCRVSCYAVMLGERLTLTASERKAVAIGAFLHDIGHLGLDDTLGPLSHPSADLQHRHTEVGARMVLPLQLPPEVGQIILYHHERHDGSGYPHGLQGEGIPRLAQIVGLAQEFDRFVMDHPTGHPTAAIEDSAEQIRQLGGTTFDPALAELFANVITECKTSIPALVTSMRAASLPRS